MKKFSELGVRSRNLTGDKITIDEILDKQIIVTAFKVADSKYSRTGLCLHLQIEYEDKKRLIFTGSGVLREDIEKVPEGDFPFLATIEKINFNDKEYYYKLT